MLESSLQISEVNCVLTFQSLGKGSAWVLLLTERSQRHSLDTFSGITTHVSESLSAVQGARHSLSCLGVESLLLVAASRSLLRKVHIPTQIALYLVNLGFVSRMFPFLS